jgi:hypothetical protein
VSHLERLASTLYITDCLQDKEIKEAPWAWTFQVILREGWLQSFLQPKGKPVKSVPTDEMLTQVSLEPSKDKNDFTFWVSAYSCNPGCDSQLPPNHLLLMLLLNHFVTVIGIVLVFFSNKVCCSK